MLQMPQPLYHYLSIHTQQLKAISSSLIDFLTRNFNPSSINFWSNSINLRRQEVITQHSPLICSYSRQLFQWMDSWLNYPPFQIVRLVNTTSTPTRVVGSHVVGVPIQKNLKGQMSSIEAKLHLSQINGKCHQQDGWRFLASCLSDLARCSHLKTTRALVYVRNKPG